MTFPLAVRQHDYETPPRAYGIPSPTGLNGPIGQVAVITVSSVSQTINLQTVVNPPNYNAAGADSQGGLGSPAGQARGAVGHFLTIFADGQDLGIIVGLTSAVVSGGAAPDLSKLGTITASGTYQSATGTCYRVKANTSVRYRLQEEKDNYLGIVAAATGTARFYTSSPPNP